MRGWQSNDTWCFRSPMHGFIQKSVITYRQLMAVVGHITAPNSGRRMWCCQCVCLCLCVQLQWQMLWQNGRWGSDEYLIEYCLSNTHFEVIFVVFLLLCMTVWTRGKKSRHVDSFYINAVSIMAYFRRAIFKRPCLYIKSAFCLPPFILVTQQWIDLMLRNEMWLFCLNLLPHQILIAISIPQYLSNWLNNICCCICQCCLASVAILNWINGKT